jgi:hypothetical protein
MTKEERKSLIDRYGAGADEVTKSLEGFPASGLTAHPIPGKWSAREIVHHLADSESISASRLHRLLAERNPVIDAYDEARFAVVLRYNDREHDDALAVFHGVRANTTPLLRLIPDDDWSRPGWHTASGLYTPETWLGIYAVHAHDHAGQIRRLRAALGA